MRSLLAAVMLLAGVGSSRAADLPACPPGWDQTKWKDPKHNSPKYVVGRIVAKYPHSPNGLAQAEGEIAEAYPGSKIVKPFSDKIDIPCVGVIDMVVNSGGRELPDNGDAWAWQVVEDKCGQCSPPLCTPPSDPKPEDAKVPDMLPTLQGVAKANPEALARQRDKEKCGDGAFLEKALDALQAKEARFGYDCDGGDCSKRSRDKLAYYFGNDKPSEGSKSVILMRTLSGRCQGAAKVVWERLPYTEKAGWTNGGRDLLHHAGCTWSPARACVEDMMIETRTGVGDCKGQNPGDGFQQRDGDWVRVLGPCSAFR